MTDSEEKSPIDQDYLDVSDFGSDLEKNQDKEFDDETDEGIFAPLGDSKKKKRTSPFLVGGAAIFFLVCAGIFYFISSSDGPSTETTVAQNKIAPPQVDSNLALAAKDDLSAPQVEGKDQSPADPSGAEALNNGAAGMPPPPLPVAEAPVSTNQKVGSSAVLSTEVKNPTEKITAKNIEDDVSTARLDEPPEIPELTKKSEISDKNGVVSDKEVNEGNASQPVSKKNELEAARETINLSKKAQPKAVYFDAPGSKALTDMPPPSINPMVEPGQSIIIIHKNKTLPENVVVKKGDDDEYIESKIVAANRAAALGMNQEALEFYNDLYTKNKRDPRILMGRAVALQKAGDTQNAIRMYQDLLDIQSNNAEAITNLMGLMGKTQPALALQSLLELRQKYPDNASVAAQLGVAYADSGDLQDGLRYLNIAAGLQPENPLHPFNMAILCEKLNDREKAIKYYEQALDSFSVHGNLMNVKFSKEVVYDRLGKLRAN